MPEHVESKSATALSMQNEEERISLCELLDRVLNKGVVVRGDIVITVADVDLLYLGVSLILSATETARQAGILLPHDMTRTIKDALQIRDREAAAAHPSESGHAATPSAPRPASRAPSTD